MIIFSGAGIIIGFAIFVGFMLGQVFTGGFDTGAAKHLTAWGASLGLGIAALLNYGLHRLSLLQKAKVYVEKDTGKEITIRPSHSLFFIPLRFWPWICGALSLWFLIGGFIQRAKSV
jgi:hypothetical protein